ncbi:alpha/beta fold hydrolase [Actinokineospora iranica]|uniref:Pimeloyl-ACP methyl ester carboxylesterase n=1 Tax=Actinokineospora iranica TaxID=1271860 RepID=A0A1G6U1L4_9PSEU|nr:alpha/beta hydrolase [Actinokineospora iranica]SDD35229.1 Pimeloyl-ACP methyl ester carboxylesterase [Actinokineospora iranica]
MPEEPGAYATANGIRLWYRDEGDPDGEPLLLIMGLNSQLIAWPDDFVAALGDRGYRVIRFDNRDSGLSDKIESTAADAEPLAPAYYLRDMADDAVGLLDYLDIDQAHVVGASMGGMIAQLVAVNHADRVRSLCSIMSTTGAPLVGLPTFAAALALLAPVPTEPEAAIEHIAKVYDVIGSRTHRETESERRRQLARASYERMNYPAGARRQVAAIAHAGNRTADLEKLTMPVLVVHGGEDALITVSGGRATHKAIQHSTYLELDTMGHDMPSPLRAEIVTAIDANAKKAAAAQAAV